MQWSGTRSSWCGAANRGGSCLEAVLVGGKTACTTEPNPPGPNEVLVNTRGRVDVVLLGLIHMDAQHFGRRDRPEIAQQKR